MEQDPRIEPFPFSTRWNVFATVRQDQAPGGDVVCGHRSIIRKEATGNGAGTCQSPPRDEPGARYGVGVPAGGVAAPLGVLPAK
jgi:hypothetical protein